MARIAGWKKVREYRGGTTVYENEELGLQLETGKHGDITGTNKYYYYEISVFVQGRGYEHAQTQKFMSKDSARRSATNIMKILSEAQQDAEIIISEYRLDGQEAEAQEVLDVLSQRFPDLVEEQYFMDAIERLVDKNNESMWKEDMVSRI